MPGGGLGRCCKAKANDEKRKGGETSRIFAVLSIPNDSGGSSHSK